MELRVQILHPDAIMPNYAHPGDVGMDLYAITGQVIEPGQNTFIYHGFALELPIGYAAIVKDKSSLSKKCLHTMGGVFDAGYRGEYNTNLINLGTEPYIIEPGDKVSQLIIIPVAQARLIQVDSLSESSRGTGAFGSTGRK